MVLVAGIDAFMDIPSHLIIRGNCCGEQTMKKLTKEQADYLIDSLESHVVCADFGECLDRGGVEGLIKRCTEQPFPELKMDAYDGGAYITFDEESLFPVKLELLNDGGCVDNTFSLEKFKEFTLGCQKIVEYIKEQKND